MNRCIYIYIYFKCWNVTHQQQAKGLIQHLPSQFVNVKWFSHCVKTKTCHPAHHLFACTPFLKCFQPEKYITVPFPSTIHSPSHSQHVKAVKYTEQSFYMLCVCLLAHLLVLAIMPSHNRSRKMIPILPSSMQHLRFIIAYMVLYVEYTYILYFTAGELLLFLWKKGRDGIKLINKSAALVSRDGLFQIHSLRLFSDQAQW